MSASITMTAEQRREYEVLKSLIPAPSGFNGVHVDAPKVNDDAQWVVRSPKRPHIIRRGPASIMAKAKLRGFTWREVIAAKHQTRANVQHVLDNWPEDQGRPDVDVEAMFNACLPNGGAA